MTKMTKRCESSASRTSEDLNGLGVEGKYVGLGVRGLYRMRGYGAVYGVMVYGEVAG
jgi:hypothetical protein